MEDAKAISTPMGINRNLDSDASSNSDMRPWGLSILQNISETVYDSETRIFHYPSALKYISEMASNSETVLIVARLF
jgi:hypothetical protein